jgi:hypothetical protein
MSKKQNLYIGRSGQLAVIAEFLYRGYNVAIPEVDVGDDVFVVRDADGDLSRIQVKAADAQGEARYSALFSVSLAQLRQFRRPPLFYVFTVRQDGRWGDFIIIRQADLIRLYKQRYLGIVREGTLIVRLTFTDVEVTWGRTSLQPYRENWTAWPALRH